MFEGLYLFVDKQTYWRAEVNAHAGPRRRDARSRPHGIAAQPAASSTTDLCVGSNRWRGVAAFLLHQGRRVPTCGGIERYFRARARDGLRSGSSDVRNTSSLASSVTRT
jgi:hypothetical protein